jgi:hypothetical protein
MESSLPFLDGRRIDTKNRRKRPNRKSCRGPRVPNSGAKARTAFPPVVAEEPNCRRNVPQVRTSPIRLPRAVSGNGNADLLGGLALLQSLTPATLAEYRSERDGRDFGSLVAAHDWPRGGKTQMAKRHRRSEEAERWRTSTASGSQTARLALPQSRRTNLSEVSARSAQ